MKHLVNSHGNLKFIVEEAKKLVGTLKKNDILKKLEIFIPQSCETRFNSIYLMLKKFQENYERILNCSRENKIDNILAKLIAIDSNLLIKYVNILEYFYNATLDLSSNSWPTIHKVIPYKILLENICKVELEDEDEMVTSSGQTAD